MSRNANATSKKAVDSNNKGGLELYLVRLSPASRMVWLYMLQNNIPHVLIDVDFSSGQNVSKFIERCPHGEVPVLVDGPIVVFEGPAILSYLATKYTNFAGFGPDLKTRMQVQSLLSWTNSELHRVVGSMYVYPDCLETYRLPDPTANEQLIAKGVTELTKHLEYLENSYLASGKSYLAGDEPTVADVFAVTVLLQTQWVRCELTMWPNVTAWMKRIASEQLYWDQVHADHKRLLQTLHQHGL